MECYRAPEGLELQSYDDIKGDGVGFTRLESDDSDHPPGIYIGDERNSGRMGIFPLDTIFSGKAADSAPRYRNLSQILICL